MLYSFCAIIIGMTTSFQNVVEADQVGFYVHIRIANGIPNASLCSEVYYDIRFVVMEDGINQQFICNVSFYKSPCGIWVFLCPFLNFRQTPLLDRDIIVIIHVVDADDSKLGLSFQNFQDKV